MTGGQMAPTTLLGQKTATTPWGRDVKISGYPLKISELLAQLAAVRYVERVSVHSPQEVNRAKKSIKQAFVNQIENLGFSLVEVLSPCPVNYGRRNKEGSLQTLKIYQEKGIIKNNTHPSELEIDFEKGIILGKFVDLERPTFSERYDKTCRNRPA